MKKILALVCGLVLCLSMAACGSKDDNSSSAKEESSSTVTESSSVAEESSSVVESNSDTVTLQDFIDQSNETFDAFKKQLEGSGMSCEILARDNSLVYSYQYTTDTIKNDDATKKTLEDTLKTQESTFKTVFDSVKQVVPEAKSVIVEYKDSKGEVITSVEFK